MSKSGVPPDVDTGPPFIPNDDPPPYSPPGYSTSVGWAQPDPNQAASYIPPVDYPSKAEYGQVIPPAQTTYIPPSPQPAGAFVANPIQPAVGYSQVVVTPMVPYGPDSLHIICPFCRADIDTATRSSPSTKAYLIGALLFFFGCYCGCCLIPCCMDSCMNIEHRCPKCNKFLGKYDSLS